MSFSIPERAQLKGPNFIRKVFERGIGVPGFISFGIGNPAAEAIPVAVIQDTIRHIIDTSALELLQYGPMQGDIKLAEQTIERLVMKRGMNRDGQGLIISIGAGQLLGLMPRTFCEEGDEVFVDAYTFTSAINAIRNVGAKPRGIATDEDGMLPEALEAAAKEGKGKYVYVIPNFQNPTGITMPLSRRKDIYEVCRAYDLMIFEDDPYGEIRFAGEDVPTFKSFDVDNRVFYAGSYSKTISAGLRVGFLFGPDKLINTMQSLKNNCDGQMPLITQRIVSVLLDTIDYDAQIQHVRDIYKKKCELMLDTFYKTGSHHVQLTRPTGGMFMWMTMPDYVDCDAFFEACMDHKVGIVPGAAFAADGVTDSHSFRLSYTVPSHEEIVKGMTILGELTKQFCKA